MSTTSTLLARLNDLRVANGKKALKHPSTVAKMEAEIKALRPKGTRETSPIADLCREFGVDPKVGRALYRRHFGSAKGVTVNDDVRNLIAASAERRAA